MARSLNKVILIGNLGSDPEIRTTGSGTRVAQFSLATSRRWTSSSGEQQEKTEWHRVVCWDKLADIVEKYLRKGNQVYIEGAIEYGSYEAKDGSGTRYTTEIRAREMLMLGGREGGGNYESSAPSRDRAPAGRGGGKKQTQEYDDFQTPPFGDEDDDLPF